MKFVLIAVAVILLIYIISKRNRFNALRREVRHQGSEIGVQMEKRAATLNDCLTIAKLSYSHEVEGVERLTVGDQLNQLAFLGQKYPDLQFTSNYGETLRKAMSLNEDITAARTLLNGNIRIYNEEITTFPGLLVAKLFGYKQETFIDDENYEENKKLKKADVDFSQF